MSQQIKSQVKTIKIMQNSTTEKNTKIMHRIAEKANETLEDHAMNISNQAFNLGCGIGLIPLIIILIGTFIITKGEWVTTIIITSLTLIMILGLANLVAYISRKNALRRILESKVIPEIKKDLDMSGLSFSDFMEYLNSNNNERFLQSNLIIDNRKFFKDYPEVDLDTNKYDY